MNALPLRLTLGAALMVLAAAPVDAAQLVVVESTMPRLAAGQVIDSEKPLSLTAGTHVSLVAEDGRMIKLQGPFKGVPATGGITGPDEGVVEALSRLFVSNQPSATSWGTVRGAETLRGDEARNPPEVWAINILRSENVCLPAGAEPVLWRPDASQELSVILLHLSTGQEATVAFAPGESTVPWPPEVALLDGGVYAIRDVANQWERRLMVRVVPPDRAAPVQQAAWMSDSGCIRQAKALITRLAS